MFDDSGISLSVSDPNATIDQVDDGGSHFDFATLLNSGMQFGTEIAAAVSGNSSRPLPVAGSPIGYTGGYTPKTPLSPTTKILIVALGGAALWFAFHHM